MKQQFYRAARAQITTSDVDIAILTEKERHALFFVDHILCPFYQHLPCSCDDAEVLEKVAKAIVVKHQPLIQKCYPNLEEKLPFLAEVEIQEENGVLSEPSINASTVQDKGKNQPSCNNMR